MKRGLDRNREYGITLLRVALGVYFISHAYYGGVRLGIERLILINTNYGIPFPAWVAWYIVLGHLVGGALMALGFYTRLGALLNIPIMAGAVVYIHFRQGFFMHGIITAKGRAIYGGYEFALFLLIATVAVFLLGGGPLAMDSTKKSRISLD